MEGFMVNTTNVNNCANDIQGYGDRIKGLKDSVSSIRLGMRHKLSARGQIERTLRGIEDRMLDEAALMSSLDQALAHIAEAYRSTERKLVTEGIRRSAGGQAVTEQQQAMMDQYMQAAIGDILQEDQFSQEAWENASIEERKEFLDCFLDRMEKEMGISLEDIQFRSGEDLGYNGAYNYADNYIALNEEILNSGDPSGAMTTLMHEARHAYQHAACENPEQFLVTADTIQGWQDSADNYKGYLQGGKYSDISSEIDAHNFAGQELSKGHVLLTNGLGDGAEMYAVRAEVSGGQTWVKEGGLTRFPDPKEYDSIDSLAGFKKEYGLTEINRNILEDGNRLLGYDTYVGYIVEGEDGTIKPGINKNPDGNLNVPYFAEGAKSATFYIGNRIGAKGAVKIDRGFAGVLGAENVYFCDSGKTYDMVIDKDVFQEEPTAMGIDDYAAGLGAGRYMEIWKAVALKDEDPEEAMNHCVNYFIKGVISDAKPISSAVSSVAMDNSLIFD